MTGTGTADDDRLVAVAQELYGLVPGEFTARRDVLAKQLRGGGDRDLARRVAALRRPSPAAWAVNLLVRTHRQEVEQLLDVGAALRDAQAALAGAELRALNRQQHQVVAAVRRRVRAAAVDAGQPISEATSRQVEGTLRAAMADPDAADAVRSGMLTTHLESIGFAPVDLGGAVAVTGAPAVPGPVAGSAERDAAEGERAGPDHAKAEEERLERERLEQERAERERLEQERAERERLERERAERQAAEEALREAADALDAAAAEAGAARDRVTELVDRRTALDARVDVLTRELAELRDQAQETAAEHKRALSLARATDRARETAERRLATARAALDRLS